MWVAIVVIIIAILLVAAMPKPNVENARAAKLGDFNIPRAKWGDPGPIVWGTVRQKSAVAIWFGDYNPVPIKQKQPSGLFGSKKVIVGYKNYVGIDLFLCLGGTATVILRKFWSGNKLVWSGTQTADGSDIVINAPELFGGEKQQGGLQGTITFYNGSLSPVQDPYLISKVDPNVPAYNCWSRALFKAFYIGTTTNLDAFSFELSCLPAGLHATYSIMPNGLDLNPMEICYDAITGNYGKFNNTTDDLNLPSFNATALTLYNEGLGMSLLVQSAITGKDMLEEVMRLCDGLLYQEPTTQKIVAKLIRQDYDVEDLPVLDSSIVKDIKNFSKTTWENTFNQCRVTFKDRENDYEDSVAFDQDFANINFQQRVKSTEIASPGCFVANTAQKLATRQLSFINVPLYKCELVCNRKAANLRPGDCFVLNWAPFGLTQMVMRISKISLGTLKNGDVKISCVQDRYATQLSTFAPPDNTEWTPIETGAQPITIRRVFAAPFHLAKIGTTETVSTFDTQGRMYAVAEQPGNASIAFDAAFSLDNFATPSTFGTEDAPYNGSGVLSADYSATAGGTSYHDTSGFSVTGMTLQAIESLQDYSTLAEARDGSALLLIDNEFFIYVGFSNIGGVITFSNVYRAVMDTERAAHLAGARVWIVSGTDGLLLPLVPNSATTYTKLLDNTPVSSLPESSATADAVAQSGRAGKPLPPDYLTLAGSRAPAPGVGATSITAAWRNRSRLVADLAAYDDAAHALETGVETRLRWRVGAGGYTTVITTASSEALNVTGLTGTLEVILDTRIVGTSNYSLTTESLTMTLS